MAGNNIYSMSNVIMFRRILGLVAGRPGVRDSSAPALAQGVAAEYKLHAGDKIEISVWKEPDLQRSVNVRPDGRFSFPLTGDVVAAGRSVEEVRGDIENRLKKYIPEPVVTVTAVETGGNRVYVIGQVARPGMFVMNPELNVLQALTLAGGPTPFAKLDSISVLRGTGTAQKTLSVPLQPGRRRQVAATEHHARKRRRHRRPLRQQHVDHGCIGARQATPPGPATSTRTCRSRRRCRRRPRSGRAEPVVERRARADEPPAHYEPLRIVEISADACEQNRVLLTDEQLRAFPQAVGRLPVAPEQTAAGRETQRLVLAWSLQPDAR